MMVSHKKKRILFALLLCTLIPVSACGGTETSPTSEYIKLSPEEAKQRMDEDHAVKPRIPMKHDGEKAHGC